MSMIEANLSMSENKEEIKKQNSMLINKQLNKTIA